MPRPPFHAQVALERMHKVLKSGHSYDVRLEITHPEMRSIMGLKPGDRVFHEVGKGSGVAAFKWAGLSCCHLMTGGRWAWICFFFCALGLGHMTVRPTNFSCLCFPAGAHQQPQGPSHHGRCVCHSAA